MKARILIEPKNVYLHAERFRMSEEQLRRSIKEPQEGAYLVGPAIVLPAFVRALHEEPSLPEGYDEPPNEHHLRKLFKKLRRDTRERISEIWDQEALPKLDGPFAVVKRKFHDFEPPTTLVAALKVGGDAFLQIRYGYEGTTSSFFLDGLPRVMKKAVLERCPQWSALGPSFAPA